MTCKQVRKYHKPKPSKCTSHISLFPLSASVKFHNNSCAYHSECIVYGYEHTKKVPSLSTPYQLYISWNNSKLTEINMNMRRNY